jgi:dipeptidyl-peptidase-4
MGWRHWQTRAVALVAVCIAMAVAAPVVKSRTDQREAAAKLLQRTIKNPDFEVKRFRGGEWSGTGDSYLAIEPSTIEGASDVVRYQTETGAREILVSASKLSPAGAKSPLKVESYQISSDGKRVLVFTNSKTVWRQNTSGDYWVLDLSSGALRKLGGDVPESSLLFAKFSPDNAKVGYVHGNNVYVEDLATAKIAELTHDGSTTVINGTSDWVNEEEFFLRDGFQWSPDSQRIAFWQFDTKGVQDYTLIYDLSAPRSEIVAGIPYPKTGPYPQTLQYPYPLAGTANSSVRVGVTSAAGGGPVVWTHTAGDPHDFYIPQMGWADSGHVLLQHMNRLQNKNDFLLADAATGVSRSVFVDEDKAWVDVNVQVPWIHQGREFLVLSERDGWRHLYRVSRESGEAKLVTRGEFDVVQVAKVTPDEQTVYFIASPDNATQRYLYRAPLDGSAAPTRVTPDQPGVHSYNISPNGQWAFHDYSSFNVPPMSEVVHLPDHRVARNTADNSALAGRVKPFSDGPAEFLKVDAGNGLSVDTWLLKPPAFDRAKKYAVIVNVYSEPAGQTTEDRWPMMFARALASAGYVVASFDNQGTPAPRGRDWRKVVYGDIGELSSQQQAAALQSLEKTHSFIDPNRVGVWGWSGGGTETLNLMFRYPDVYRVGVSVASVPDQRLYDSIYQERYLGLPQDNPKAYERSSAINFVSGLRGDLMVMHGSGDDNVHFQGFELLVNKLISLGKPFDMRVYPGRTHSISEGSGTTLDVYTNILGYFEDRLPPGPQASSPN